MNVARRSHQGSANCSEECTVAFHVATTTVAETATLPAPDGPNLAIGSSIAGSVSEKNRSHLALRRAWDAEHTPGEGLSPTTGQPGRKKARFSQKQLREWFTAKLAPLLAKVAVSEIRAATGLSARYTMMIRQSYVPHPRHFSALAKFAGVPAPTELAKTDEREVVPAPPNIGCMTSAPCEG
jgi:hypothetical protein